MYISRPIDIFKPEDNFNQQFIIVPAMFWPQQDLYNFTNLKDIDSQIWNVGSQMKTYSLDEVVSPVDWVD